LKSRRTIPLRAMEVVFRFMLGKRYLKKLLKEDVEYGSVTSQSFRAGFTRLGISEDKCCLVGRWHSDA